METQVAPAAAPITSFEALEALGGPGAGNPLSAAVTRLTGGAPDPSSVFLSLGGEGAANRLALAVASFVQGLPAVSRQNLTAQWLEKNYAEVFANLRTRISRRMRKSREMGLVDDHVQGFLARLVERDDLADYLRAGLPIKPSVLNVWATQYASTEVRGWGTQADLRTSRGARTARERVLEQETREAEKAPPGAPPRKVPVSRSVAVAETVREVVTNRDAGPGESLDRDLWDPSAVPADEMLVQREHHTAAKRLLGRLAHGENAAHVAVIRGVLAGRPLAAVAAAHGIAPADVTAFADRFRTLLASAPR